jgi:CRISP-associated protein Cas1
VPALYVTEQGAWIRKTGDRLVVEKGGEVLLDVPCLKIDTVLLYGNVQFTTQALVEMLDHGIEMALLSQSGRLRGQLTPPKAKNIVLRMSQFQLARHEAFCLGFAREVVRGKVTNGAAVLERFRVNHPQRLARSEIDDLQSRLGAIERASSLDALRGVEGAAAAAYFKLLGRLLPDGLAFEGRHRRPPTDPFNSLLSFGYVLVGNEIQALLDAMGYDPYLGFFHQIDYGRPSLALDLLEEFRPALVDRFSVKLFNLGVLQPGDFSGDPERGVYLNPDGKRKYFRAYEQELTEPISLGEQKLTFRRLFQRQAELLARALRGEEPYKSFELPC